MVRVGLIGDFNPAVTAHQAIPRALALVAEATRIQVESTWLPTETITTASLERFDALWCVPASPYRSTEGALHAIEFARKEQRPFLGTCGGFQHAVIEYARSVLGWSDAEHGETAGDAVRQVITGLQCELVEASETVHLHSGTRLAAAYGVMQIVEGYHCRFGVNPEFQDELFAGALRVTAVNAAGDVRAVELAGHPFFVATLFQPERAALSGTVPPVVGAFVAAGSRGRSR